MGFGFADGNDVEPPVFGILLAFERLSKFNINAKPFGRNTIIVLDEQPLLALFFIFAARITFFLDKRE